MELQINGQPVQVDVDPNMPLLWVLRDMLNMTGTKFGCGVAACGACTVHIDGQAVRSCVLPVSAVAGKRIQTIEALGTQATFEAALRVLRPGGTLSSLGVYATDLRIPLDAFAAGLGDHRIVTSLCPGGKERMRRLMSVIQSHRLNLSPLVTHRFKLDDIEAAYDLFGHQRDGVLKVAITP